MSAYSDLILAHGSLVAYWRMGEASGTTLADSKGTNTGTLVASGITYGVTGPLVNDANTALTFDGTVNPATVPDVAALDLGDGPFAIEFWAKRSATGADHVIVHKSTGAYYVLFQGSDNKLVLRNSPTIMIASTSAAITDSNWHHYVITKNGSATFIYQDGVDVTAAGTAQTLVDTATQLRIGFFSAAGGGKFPGSLDELAIYKGAVLSAAEVLQHYRTGLGAIGLTDAVTLSDSQAKDVGQALADAVTSSESRTADDGAAQTDSVTTTDAISSAPGLVKVDSVPTSDAVSNEPGPVKTETVTLTDSEVADIGVARTDSVTLSDSQSKDVAQAQADSVTLSDALTTADAVALGDTVTVDDDVMTSLSGALSFDLADAVTLTDSASADVTTTQADSVTLSDQETTESGHALTDTENDSVTLFDFLSTHLETEGSGTGQQPGGGGFAVRVPVIKPAQHTVGLADVLILSDVLHPFSHLDPDLQREEEELLALV